MISVLASIQIKPECFSEFVEMFKANVPTVREEDGCIEYFPSVDIESGLPPQVLDGNMVTVIEKWRDLDALRAHLAAPHMVAYKEKTKDMVEGVTLKVLQEA